MGIYLLVLSAPTTADSVRGEMYLSSAYGHSKQIHRPIAFSLNLGEWIMLYSLSESDSDSLSDSSSNSSSSPV
jgi:hypothetical protein